MKKLITYADRERFQSGAHLYAAYLEKPEGRLRLDLAFANLQEFLHPSKGGLCALDIGGGTGATAVRLMHLGYDVTLLDCSSEMLQMADRAARVIHGSGKLTLKQGDAAELPDLFDGGSFDLILCHNVLEYVDDPDTVLRSVARLMRDSSAVLSLVVRNPIGEVLKAALREGDLESSEKAVDAKWGHESLYGGRVRLFTVNEIFGILREAKFEVITERGVRVLLDYLPAQISRETEYERIFKLERKLGSRPEFAAIARYKQFVARRAEVQTENIE